MADLLSEKYFKEQARWLDERDLRYFSVMKSYFLEFRKPAQDRSSLAGVLRREQEQGLNGVNYDTMKRLRKRMVIFFGEDDHFNLLDFNDEKPQVALTEEWIFQAFGASNLFFLSQSSSNYSFIFTYEQELQLVAKAKAEIEGPRASCCASPVNTMISFYKNNRHLLQDKHTLPEKKSGEQRAWANSLFEFVTSSRLDKEIEWVPLS